jgi:hypothetical protein
MMFYQKKHMIIAWLFISGLLLGSVTGCGRSGERDTLFVRYAFDGDVLDRVGNRHAECKSFVKYVNGPVGLAIDLDGAKDYVQLPTGLFDTDDLTITAWIKWDGGSQWQRIFDFGDSQSSMYLTPRSGDDQLSFAIRSGNKSIQQLRAGSFPVDEWIHIALVLNGDIGMLYLNGAVASIENIYMNPSDINCVNNYIGKSQWSNPLFSGCVDDFRIYHCALSGANIAEIYGNLTQYPAMTNDSTPPSSVSSSSVAGAEGLIAYYKFEGADGKSEVYDSIGDNHGIASGNLEYRDGISGKALVFDGYSTYVRLPLDLSNVDDITIATWFYVEQGGRTWARVFDFGNGTSQCMHTTILDNSGRMSFYIWKGSLDNLEGLHTYPAVGNAWTHIAVRLESDTGSFFVNGKMVHTGKVFFNPSDINPGVNYLGKSQFDVDPLFIGRMDDFRIYNYALPNEAVAALANRLR